MMNRTRKFNKFSLFLGTEKLPALRLGKFVQHKEKPKQPKLRPNMGKMAKDHEGNKDKRVWTKLCRNNIIMLQDIPNQGVQGKTKVGMKILLYTHRQPTRLEVTQSFNLGAWKRKSSRIWYLSWIPVMLSSIMVKTSNIDPTVGLVKLREDLAWLFLLGAGTSSSSRISSSTISFSSSGPSSANSFSPPNSPPHLSSPPWMGSYGSNRSGKKSLKILHPWKVAYQMALATRRHSPQVLYKLRKTERTGK